MKDKTVRLDLDNRATKAAFTFSVKLATGVQTLVIMLLVNLIAKAFDAGYTYSFGAIFAISLGVSFVSLLMAVWAER